jgi:beta-galactosidase
LKEFGCNAYRTSHNPPTPELLQACDRLGMIVMDENRLLGSDENNLKLLETEVRRDRNHPSVCIWSICNEEPTQTQPVSERVGATMQAVVKGLDPTRPVTAAENTGDVFTGLPGTLEVRGWNYNIGTPGGGSRGAAMDNYHKEHPDQPNLGTEQGSDRSTRGIYQSDPQRGYLTARQFGLERWWRFFADRPWLSGAFYWTGFDYRGEPSPFKWPCINSHFGVLDTCGFPKDDAYYLKASWTTAPMVHLLPHWTWPGNEGRQIEVDAFSNCADVELFLNGQSLGKQSMPKGGHLVWQVKYAPGTLSAKGYNDGKTAAEDKVETTGEPESIRLNPDRATIKADGEDLSLFTVSVTDANGRVAPRASNMIHFDLTGPGRILGVGNGDPSCHEPDTFISQPPVRPAWSRSVFNGLAQVIVQSTRDPGEIELKATADGLKPATGSVQTQPAEPRPELP